MSHETLAQLPMTDDAATLMRFLSDVPVVAVRMEIQLDARRLDVPRMRGVWGAALHAIDEQAYECVFKPTRGLSNERPRLPGYVVRAARAGDERHVALELVLIGESVECLATSLRAWDIASGMGLGPERTMFPIIDRRRLSLSGSSCAVETSQRLSDVASHLTPDLETAACELQLETPLSLLRDGKLIVEPQLVDVVGKTCRRLEAYLPDELRAAWYEWRQWLINDARTRPAETQVRKAPPLHRFSARQNADIYVPGVLGTIRLPLGAGPLLPLLLALQWLHVGKSCNVGQGQMTLRFASGTLSAPHSLEPSPCSNRLESRSSAVPFQTANER